MIENGKTVKVVPSSFGELIWATSMTSNKAMEGTVVYIHPEGRYYTVDFGNGCRESFIIEDIMERLAICQRSRDAGYRRAL